MNLCIHGHFYQPPREDPISNYIPSEIGSEPFNNWNEKILAECYEPNALAGNFGKISFNIGPTLFRWMTAENPEVAQLIVEQERENFERFGIGNGMAQSFHHTILPLATKEDKITQVYWGISDFEMRFGHKPQGIWLPETAVDIETLCVLSDLGLKFTILAPWQIETPDNGKEGAYLIELPEGREPFIVFPYNRELSTMISFIPESTSNGDRFLQIVREKTQGDENDLTFVASDGELYGHHQVFRDKFLTYLLNSEEQNPDVRWSFPGLWLAENRVKTQARLISPSSWSCFHGVQRWQKECDCTPGADWKEPLFYSMRTIADWLDGIYADFMKNFVNDPARFRNEYIYVYNSQMTLTELLEQEGNPSVSAEDLEKIALLMEAQVKRQCMFTSCGWFFEEFHRIEPQNNIAYAAMAVWLTEKASGIVIPDQLLETLKDVRDKKTGLRADTVFTQTLLRAVNEA